MRKAITSKRRIKLLTEAIKSAREESSSCHCQGIDEGKKLDALDAMRKLHMAWKPSTEEGELYKQQLGDAISSVKTGDDIGEGLHEGKDRFTDQDGSTFDVGARVELLKRRRRVWQGTVVDVKKKSGVLYAVVATGGGKKRMVSPDEMNSIRVLDDDSDDEYSVVGDQMYDHRKKKQYPRDDPDW